MNLTELVDAVYEETNRPDLDTQTAQAVRSSVLKMHTLDFFYKDIASARLVFDSSAYIQQIDTTVFPRYRSLSYFRKDDPALSPYQVNPLLQPPFLNGAGAVNISQSMGFIKILTPDDILDSYGAEKLDVGYQAGTSIWIKSSSAFRMGLLGFYRYPDISDATFDSWIATEYPYSIIYDAASHIAVTGGNQEVSRKMDGPDGLATQAKNALIFANIVAVGS